MGDLSQGHSGDLEAGQQVSEPAVQTRSAKRPPWAAIEAIGVWICAVGTLAAAFVAMSELRQVSQAIRETTLLGVYVVTTDADVELPPPIGWRVSLRVEERTGTHVGSLTFSRPGEQQVVRVTVLEGQEGGRVELPRSGATYVATIAHFLPEKAMAVITVVRSRGADYGLT